MIGCGREMLPSRHRFGFMAETEVMLCFLILTIFTFLSLLKDLSKLFRTILFHQLLQKDLQNANFHNPSLLIFR